MSRTTDNEEEDEIESTFRKLYRKYVTDSEPDLTKTSDKEEGSLAERVTRRFESSKSEAEDDDNSISEEEEDEILSKYQAKGLRRASSASSITPRASVCNSPSKDVTPKCSPLPARKELKTLEKSISRSVSPEMKPLTRSFQMEATFGITAPKKDTEDVKNVTGAESVISKKDSENVPKSEFGSFKTNSEAVSKTESILNSTDKTDPLTTKKDSEAVTKTPDPPKPTAPTRAIQIPDDVPKLVDMSSDEDDSEEEESAEEADDPLKTKKEVIEVGKVAQPAPPTELEPIKKVVSTIRINGIPVKEATPEPVRIEKEAQKEGLNGPVRIRIRDKSPSRIREEISPSKETTPKPTENLISSAVNVVLNHPEEKSKEEKKKKEESRELSEEKSSESDTTTTSSRASSLRKRRDPNRTLETLQSILKAEKMNNNGEFNEEKKPEKEENSGENKEENGNEEKKTRRIPIPLVLITEPSNPSTPLATTPVTTAASICLWNNTETKRTSSSTEDDEEYDEEEDYSSGDWTEGEDDKEYITDEEEGNEFSVSQTFSLKDHINLRELYPLATSASNTSALVSEFSDGDTFLADARKEESRGRVDSLFAVPAPTFTCSVTYDGMMPGDDDEEWSDEVHSCEEGDDDDFRVLPIARPGSSSLGAYMSPGSMTSDDESGSNYDGRTVGCTLKLVDRAARKDSDETDESEYYDDEEELEDEEYEDEEYWDEEIEYEDEEEYEYEEDEEILEEYVDEEEEEEEEDGEEDVTMKSVEEEESSEEEMSMMESEECHELFVTPPIKLMTESLVEEMIEEACYGEIPEETLFALDEIEVEDYTGQKDVHLIPTFVRQTTEDIREESTSRFASDRKPATDFAKKAVIQPTKLEKVQVGTKIDTKVAPSEEEKKKMKEEEERKKREEEEEKKRKEKEMEMQKKKKEEEEKEKKEKETKKAEALAAGKEDKSALRKSALNMKDEDAKKKVATDEKTAAQKARRYGTVSAMAGKFDETEEIKEKKEEKVLYKKSSRLESRDAEKPKRVYEVIKPVINDDFDKQMEEIRMQMKSGSNQLQNKMKDLSKGILTVKEEAKSREMEEKRRVTTEKATGAFGKAEEEKARWKASRDAEAAREYAKIEAEKHLKKKRILIDKPTGETVLNQEKSEAPKRTIRRWKPPPPDPNAVIPSFSCGPKEAAKPKIAAESSGKTSKPTTPTARRKSLASPVTVPKESSTVAAAPAPVISNIPKSEGAAATRIRNQAAVAATTTTPSTTTVIPSSTPSAPSSVTDSPKPTSRRYNARRKTQEIVNESLVKPKTKRRKRNPRKTRFTRADRDADILLGYEKGSTFEQLERLFDQATRNRRPITAKFEKIRRLAPSKIFISELTDIDKIYKSSEIRDIIASVNLVY